MTRHKSHDERRAQILGAARTCFIRAGYAHTRVDDIAKEAGLSKGGIYFHFKSKREIFDALHGSQQAQTKALVEQARNVEGSASEALSTLAATMVNHLLSADDRRKFLIVLAEMGMRDPEIHQNIVDAHEDYVDALAAHIQAGIDSGEFRQVDAHQTAMLLKVLIDGVEQGMAIGYQFDAMPLMLTTMDILFNGLSNEKRDSEGRVS